MAAIPRRANKILLFLMFVVSNSLMAQNVGDYRSVASGNWINTANWEVYNGSNWVAATTYPGELAGTNDVAIIGGHSISISSNIPNTFNSLAVGDGSGATDNFFVAGTSSLQTQLITIADGGLAEWTSNVSFSLPSGAAFIIEPGGALSEDNPCSASKRLIIGSTIYSTCNGAAGADYSFADLSSSGGSLAVSPSSNTPVCEGGTLNLYSNPSGAGSAGASYSWSGTGPLGYTYSSGMEDPVINGLSSGSYTYTVTISDGFGNANTNSIDVTIIASATILSQPSDQTIIDGEDASFTVLQINGDSFQWQVSTDGGTSFNDITDGVEYNGTQNSTLNVLGAGVSKNAYLYRVLVSDSSSTGCAPVISSSAMLSVIVNTIITNRGVTYRVNKY